VLNSVIAALLMILTLDVTNMVTMSTSAAPGVAHPGVSHNGLVQNRPGADFTGSFAGGRLS